jgi:cell fate regulator YaaT (PSP1 superfamily)
MAEVPSHDKHNLAIKLRKFDRICPITGYKEESIKIGAPVIVQTDRGVEAGVIQDFPLGLPKALSRDVKLKKVLRYATPHDVEKINSLTELESKALLVAGEKVKEHELKMKIVAVEYLFDTTRAIIYYKVPENDKTKNFRELARDISSHLGARIDLHQISPRDEARIMGGLGPCGRSLCCATWLEKPRHVTVRMVKDQGLAISPTKTAGICGRLMCCLEYEHEKKN